MSANVMYMMRCDINTFFKISNFYTKNVIFTKWGENLELYGKAEIRGRNKKITILLCLSGQKNGTNWTKAFVKGLLAPEFNIVGGAVAAPTIAYITSVNVMYSIVLTSKWTVYPEDLYFL